MKISRKTLIIGASILFLFLIFKACSHNINFNSGKWKEWNEQETNWNLRWDMSDDLIDNYLKKGMTEKEVIELLGDEGKELHIISNFDLYYNLGPCRRGIDYGSLTIYFENKKLKTAKTNCQ